MYLPRLDLPQDELFMASIPCSKVVVQIHGFFFPLHTVVVKGETSVRSYPLYFHYQLVQTTFLKWSLLFYF